MASFRDPFDIAQQCLTDPVFQDLAGPLYRDAFSGDPLFRASCGAELDSFVNDVAYGITFHDDLAQFDPTYACGLVPVEMTKKVIKTLAIHPFTALTSWSTVRQAYMSHIKTYVKRLKGKIKERGGDLPQFVKNAEKFAARPGQLQLQSIIIQMRNQSPSLLTPVDIWQDTLHVPKLRALLWSFK